jgi:glycosyltransferase involved in cell wall biosynthesis
VDSDSSDSSVKLAQKYQIKIVIIKGDINAAVGRNQGAAHSSGDILFFIDGDMEIKPNFYNAAFINDAKLKYPFCTGDLLNKFYDMDYNDLNESSYEFGTPLLCDTYEHTGGGYFVIERKYWILLDGMDERYGRNEDLDFFLSMSRLGLPALRYKELFAVHHTVRYFDKDRIKIFLKSKHLLYYGLLIRKYFFYKIFWQFFLRSRYSLLILLASVIFKPCVIIYLMVQLGRTIKNLKKDKEIIRPFFLRTIADLYCLAGLMFFFPSFNKEFSVQLYQN